MIQTILVADYGTSNVRVNAITAECGDTMASAAVKYRPAASDFGYCELDAEQMWESAQICMQETVGKIDLKKYQIAGISFSFFGDGMVPVDREGNPTHNLFLCFDPRGKEEAEEINRKVGKQRILELIGDVYESGCTGAKILYFKRHMPDAAAKTVKYDTIQQFILRKLGLSDVNDITMACRKSLLDNEQKIWAKELLEAVGTTEEQLGEIVAPDKVLGKIKRFGKVILPYSVPVIAGAHDSDCGYVGLGINGQSRSDVAEVAGTFDHIGMIVPGHVNCHLEHPAEDIWSGSGPLPDSSSCLSAYATSGALLEWFMTEIIGSSGQEAYQDLWNHVIFDGTGGVQISPQFIVGEGAVNGLSVTSTKYDIFRAIIEMLTFETRRCIELCQNVNPYGIDTVRIGGGGAREDKWVQLRADITGKTYQRMNEIESSALGAAMLAAVGVGIYPDITAAAEKMTKVQKTFKPNPHVHALYEERYQSYLRKYYG